MIVHSLVVRLLGLDLMAVGAANAQGPRESVATGVVRIGGCECFRCFDSGSFGTDFGRVLQRSAEGCCWC